MGPENKSWVVFRVSSVLLLRIYPGVVSQARIAICLRSNTLLRDVKTCISIGMVSGGC